MRCFTVLAALFLGAVIAAAQPAGFEIDTETPAGKALQRIGLEEDPQGKIAMIEQFLQAYPDHAAATWVMAQLPPAYASLNQPAESLAACAKLMERDPANAAAAHSCLKTAEAQKDPDLIKTWALSTYAAAQKAISAPEPKFEDEEQEEEWKQSINFATQVGSYAEWSIYNTVLTTPDPDKRAALANALKEADPESEYLPKVLLHTFIGYLQAGQAERSIDIITEAMAVNAANDDMLLVAADFYTKKQDYDKALEYSTKLVDYFESAPAPPEGVTPEDWEKKKTGSLGKAYYMIGSTYVGQKKYSSADKALRKGLPLFQGNAELLAGALFHLGLANYQLGNASGDEKRILDAFNFTKQCAGMSSPFQAQAKKNLASIQSQYRIK